MNNLFEIANSQLANVYSRDTSLKQIPIELVDSLADELVAEYQNPLYRKWYCSVIYSFGSAQVQEWRTRASGGKQPGRLFTLYVNQAKGYRRSTKVSDAST